MQKSGDSVPRFTLSLAIPAYNAADRLGTVISRVPAELWDTIISVWIIDDGSTDSTTAEIDRLSAQNKKIRKIRFEVNRGYGHAVRAGIAECRNDGCDFAVCLHSDGQYPPERIPEFIAAMQQGPYDLMQGSRIASGTALSGGMPLHKFIANRLLTMCENIVFGLRMTDYHSGYLFYSRRAMEQLPFERFSGSFDFDLEVIACAQARGLRIGELPIPTRYAGEISHVRSIPYGLRVLRVMGRYLAGRYSLPS